jgi:hypothetical protein
VTTKDISLLLRLCQGYHVQLELEQCLELLVWMDSKYLEAGVRDEVYQDADKRRVWHLDIVHYWNPHLHYVSMLR